MADNISAEQLLNISNPAANYVEGSTQSEASGLSADQLADISNPANQYNEPLGLTPDEQNQFGVPPEAYSDPAPKQSQSAEFDEKGNVVGKADEPDLNKDTAALTQTGAYSNPGFFGDQQMTNSNVAFGKAVDGCLAFAGFAGSLQKTKAPKNYVRTPSNYLLTDKEKEAIELKSIELAAIGVIPVDIIRTFFYILAAIENQSDLSYIGSVVGIPEIDNPNYIRNIRGILGISTIYKIQYLANGVASVINTFASKYSTVNSIADPYRSTIGDLERSRDLALSLGVIGPILLSTANNLNGNQTILRNIPELSSSAAVGAINSLAQLAGGNAVGLVGAAVNPSAVIQNIASRIGAGAITSLLNNTPLGGALAAFGPLGQIVAGPLLQQFGGYAIGSFMAELITGSRIPCQKIANNPSLRPPSYAGKSFFGETPCALPAVDQVFCRKIGSFGAPTGASGADSFGMQNFASFGGSQSLSSIVTRMVTGSSVLPPQTTFIGQSMTALVSNISSILNVPSTSSIEMRRSDNSIPFMIGLSAAIAEETFSPFGSKVMSEGWKLASSSANDIQKTNPQFLETCRTSL